MEENICPRCPWSREPESPLIYKLIDYLDLIDAGCPVERHELTNYEWLALGEIKKERDRLSMEEARRGEGNQQR